MKKLPFNSALCIDTCITSIGYIGRFTIAKRNSYHSKMAAYTARETLTDQPTCQSCIADGVPAVSFCSHANCLTFMCHNCDQAHRTMRQFKDHDLHSIEDLQKRPASHTSGQSLLCKEHRQNPLSLYCDEKNCQKAICVSCAATAHSSHRVVVLETKSFEAKKVLQSLVAEVRSKIDHTHLISGQLNTEKNLTSDLFKKRSAEVSAITKDLQELLTKRQDAVILEMKKKCLDISSHLTSLADYAETLSCRFKSACQDAEGTCDIGNPVDLLNALAHHTSIFHELNAIDVDEAISFHTERETRFPSFDEDRDQLFSDFEKFVSRIGRLNASTGNNAVSFKIDFPNRVASPLYAKAMHRVRITSEDPSCSFGNLNVCPHTFFQSPDGNTGDCKYVQQCGDSYEFEFKPLVAGPHQLHIYISGAPIKGSPFPVDIEETPPLMANTDDLSLRATNINKPDANSADAFVECEHTVVVKLSGLVSLQSLPAVSARFFMLDLQASHDSGTPSDEVRNHQYTEAQVMTTGDLGHYRVIYTPPAPGKLVMDVFMDGQHIANSPSVINVHPLHPDSTMMSPHQLGKCPPGTAVLDMPYSLTLQTCDHHGERLTSGGYNITADITTSSSEEPKRQGDVQDNEDGSYTVTVTPRAPEPLIVNIKICGYPLTSGMPLVIPVQDSLPFEDPPGGYKNPSGMAVDTNRKAVYITDIIERVGCYIRQLKTDGSFVSTKMIKKLPLPLNNKSQLDLAVAQDGRLFALFPHSKGVVTCNYNGKSVEWWPCAEDNHKPVSITLSRSDHVIVGDGDSHKLYIHQRKGEIMGCIQLPEGALSAGTQNVCVDSAHDDILVVTHSEPYQILRYTINGDLVCTIDLTTKTTQQAVAAESTPEGALILSLRGRILVLTFSPDRKATAVVKMLKTDHAYTRLAVIGDECFVAFDPAAKHLAKYSYHHRPLH